MKKIIVVLLLLIIILLFSMYALVINTKTQTRILRNYNKEYEKYLNQTIYGTELATLINKVININENNKVEKDKKEHYIENKKNSIKIDVTMLLTEKTYPMEEIYNKDTAQFIKHFDLETFKCTKIEYHEETGKISKMFFDQIEEQ